MASRLLKGLMQPGSVTSQRRRLEIFRQQNIQLQQELKELEQKQESSSWHSQNELLKKWQNIGK